MGRRRQSDKTNLERAFGLAPAEALVLSKLRAACPAMVSNEDLIAALGTHSGAAEKLLRVRICNIRSKIRGSASIATLKTGYLLESGADELDRIDAGGAPKPAAAAPGA